MKKQRKNTKDIWRDRP